MRIGAIFTVAFLAVSFTVCRGSIEEKKTVIGNEIADFKLKNTDGNVVSLSGFSQAKGFIIVFTCNHCPFAKLYTKRLNMLNSKYKPLHVPLLAINSMDTLAYREESFERMKKRSEKEKYNFPYLQDASQDVAKAFKADHTPQAYVLWKKGGTWAIEYSVAIDDNGAHPAKSQNNYIENAVSQLLRNEKVSV
ncbi:MAG TPA: thioredoxin family protein [Flavobacteriales bacterium]|nr:thioredoxin family protein [Flavobacteriales bacterium]